MRTRVKICGITRRQDAEFAIEMGADALGFVFFPPSPRAINFAQAQQLLKDLPPFVSNVALFVDAQPDEVKTCLATLPIDVLQFHGNESVEYCEQFNHPYMKAIRMRDDIELETEINRFKSASAILLDSYQPGVPGGTGQTFDWSLIKGIRLPLVLAGGINVENVGQAIKQVKPYAVDVSGGVELSKGIKDKDKIRDFMQEVAKLNV